MFFKSFPNIGLVYQKNKMIKVTGQNIFLYLHAKWSNFWNTQHNSTKYSRVLQEAETLMQNKF